MIFEFKNFDKSLLDHQYGLDLSTELLCDMFNQISEKNKHNAVQIHDVDLRILIYKQYMDQIHNDIIRIALV